MNHVRVCDGLIEIDGLFILLHVSRKIEEVQTINRGCYVRSRLNTNADLDLSGSVKT